MLRNPHSKTRFTLIVIGFSPISGKVDTKLILVDCDDLDVKLGVILFAVFIIHRNGMNTEWTEFTVALTISTEGLLRNEITRISAFIQIFVL
jgi:hypothetical protein